MRKSENPRIGLLASPGDIRISMVCRAKSRKEATQLVCPLEREIRRRLQSLVYGVDNETLEGKVVEYLGQLKLCLSVADALTGGLLCHKILMTGTTRFLQGFVLPSKKSQMSFLNLHSKAFSVLALEPEEHSRALARKVLLHGDVGLSVSGHFEASGREQKGRLFVSVAQGMEEDSRSWRIGGTYDGLIERASILALDTLRRHLLNRRGVEG
jgi:nicotinamide-nucleotide amidase